MSIITIFSGIITAKYYFSIVCSPKLCEFPTMKTVISYSVFAFCLANSLMASGLLETSAVDDPEVRSPFITSTVLCSDINPRNGFDYSRSYLHYHLALGQSIKQAEVSATNVVTSHQQARIQTCDAIAKAVTDGLGHPVRDGNGNVVINLP